MSVLVLRGDAAHLPLPDGSVDLIVTSPPYFGQRDYRDGGQSLEGQIGNEATPREYIAAMLACTVEWMRVLKPSGSIFVNLGDKYSQRVASRPSSHQDGLFPGRPQLRKDWKRDRAAGLARMPYENVIDAEGNHIREKSLMGLPWRYAIGCMDDLGLIVRRDNIWHKLSALPESADDRCVTRHEYVFHLTPWPDYFAAVDEIREPHSAPGRQAGANAFRARNASIPRTATGDYDGQNSLGKLPGSVWEIAPVPLNVPERIEHARCCGGRKRPGCEDGLDHHAAFPPALARRAILGWSPSGICLECSEGRSPVTIRASREPNDRLAIATRARTSTARGTHVGSTLGYPAASADRRILGYACACTPYTDHPGTPGIRPTAQTRSVALGNSVRDNPGGGYGNAERTGPWREYHLEGWVAPPTRPAAVVDPFGGTGTTALVADVLGRTGISVDRSADYCRLARWRTRDPGERARALGVPKPPPVPEGQASLFDLEAS